MHNFQEEDQILFEAIEAYKKGNGDKATIIYESTKKYTFNILHKGVERYKNQGALTSDVVSITEDIMQELYIEFFNKIANFRNEDPKSIFKWISVVAQRRLRTYVKENGTEVLQFEKDEDFREEGGIWDSTEINDSDMESNHELLPEAALEDKEFQELILDFIQSLPESQAQTILLHFRGGLKYQEIADEMGVSLITVKTRMKKAKDSLEEIINRYEKKTGTKLHSVSILPLLWLFYRMASEDTTVPVAVDAAVTSSVVGASGVGIGSTTTVGATAVTKAISTRVLVAIVSTAVAIGGVAVGSQLVDKKQETTIEQGDSEDKEKDNSNDNKQDNEGGDDTSSKTDTDTSNTNGEQADSTTNQSNQNETADGNDTNLDNNVTQDGNGTGNNTNGTDGNGGTGGSGDNSGNEGTGGSESNTGNGNDSGNEDTSESTVAKGTKENPYRIGEKIVISNAAGYSSSDTSSYDVEITVTDYTIPKLENAEYVSFGNTEMILNVVKARIKITRDNSEPCNQSPLILGLYAEDGRGNSKSGYLHKQDGDIITSISNNAEYDIGFHMLTGSFNEELTYSYFSIGYRDLNNSLFYIYVKVE